MPLKCWHEKAWFHFSTPHLKKIPNKTDDFWRLRFLVWWKPKSKLWVPNPSLAVTRLLLQLPWHEPCKASKSTTTSTAFFDYGHEKNIPKSLKVLKSLGSNQMESLYNDISDRLLPMTARTFTNLTRSQDLQFLVSPWSKHLAKTCCEGLIRGHSTREIRNVSFKALVKYLLSIIIDLNR